MCLLRLQDWRSRWMIWSLSDGEVRDRFLIVIEKADGNYSAYSPDLPGCVATGKTRY